MSYFPNNESATALNLSVGTSLTLTNTTIDTIQNIAPTATPTFNQIILSSAPTLSNSVATKAYVDSAIATDSYIAGPNIIFLAGTGTSQEIAVKNPPTFTQATIANAPVNTTDTANKAYVDQQITNAKLTAGTGITITSGTIATVQDISTSANPNFNQVTITTQPTQANQVATLSTVQNLTKPIPAVYSLVNYNPSGAVVTYDLGNESSTTVWYTNNFLGDFMIQHKCYIALTWDGTGRLQFWNQGPSDYLFWDTSLPTYMILSLNITNGTPVGGTFVPTSVTDMVTVCQNTAGANFVIWNLSGTVSSAQCYSNSGMSSGINIYMIDYLVNKYSVLVPE